MSDNASEHPKLECVVCKKGRAEGRTLYRINEMGVPGLWACGAHLSQTDGPKPDPIVEEIISAIEHSERNNQPSVYKKKERK